MVKKTIKQSKKQEKEIIHLPLKSFSERDRKIIEILHKQHDYVKLSKFKAHVNQYQNNYYRNTRIPSGKVNIGHTAYPILVEKGKYIRDSGYKGFDISSINKKGKIVLTFN